MGQYPIGVAGESFTNDDGSSRQAEIRRCRAGERVDLVREPDNPHDPLAVRVVSERGVQIGYLPTSASWIAERLDKARTVEAAIKDVTGSRGKNGVVLWVSTDGQLPEVSASDEDVERTVNRMTLGCFLAIVAAIVGLGALIF